MKSWLTYPKGDSSKTNKFLFKMDTEVIELKQPY